MAARSEADASSPPRPRVGIPRSLLYHRYHTLWREFLAGIGCEPVVSPSTDACILEVGCELAPDEACLPVKLQVGHIARLLESGVDRVLRAADRRPRAGTRRTARSSWAASTSPRTSSRTRRSSATPSTSATAGFASASGPGSCPSADGWAPPHAAMAAYERARAAAARARADERRAERRRLRERDALPTVLVVGHSYNLADEFLGARPVRILEQQGVRVVSAEALRVPAAQQPRSAGARRLLDVQPRAARGDRPDAAGTSTGCCS